METPFFGMSDDARQNGTNLIRNSGTRKASHQEKHRTCEEIDMQPESTDETTIKEMHATMIEAWNKGSGAGFAAGFAPDADFIAFEGSQLKGRTQIAQFHQMLFDTSLKGTRLEGGVHFVRLL